MSINYPRFLLHSDNFYRMCFIRSVILWHGKGVWASVSVSMCGSVRKTCKHDTDWTVPARTVKLDTHASFDKRTISALELHSPVTRGEWPFALAWESWLVIFTHPVRTGVKLFHLSDSVCYYLTLHQEFKFIKYYSATMVPCTQSKVVWYISSISNAFLSNKVAFLWTLF